ncbi:hypothetical protein [Ruminococcus flavefaciens]|uniref:hypothetical protein n=1 Tax=Ruminococcus flavefaciens TaxID=1265 RepID=UPI00037C30D8|nr:hypothetical protein [Ruminococcus flavefaciens]
MNHKIRHFIAAITACTVTAAALAAFPVQAVGDEKYLLLRSPPTMTIASSNIWREQAAEMNTLFLNPMMQAVYHLILTSSTRTSAAPGAGSSWRISASENQTTF